MLSKAQKVILYMSAVLTLLLGLVIIVPFRTIPGITVELGTTMVTIELVVKGILLVAILGLSIYPNILKYRFINNRLERSKVANVMGYFPMAVYLASMFALNINTLSFSQEPLGFPMWSMLFILFVFDFMFVVVGFNFLPKLLVKLNKAMTLVLDIVLLIVAAVVLTITIKTSLIYSDAFGASEAYFGVGDPVLFVTYIVAVVGFIVACQALYKVVKQDRAELYINFELQKIEDEKIKNLEYQRAYNDILDDFEEFFEENNIKSSEPKKVEDVEEESSKEAA